jgi:hypothetical protein
MTASTTSDRSLGEITVFKKSNGPLTKHIVLRDGKIVNDSKDCRMASGTARRFKVNSVQALADLINGFGQSEAYALGRLKDGVKDGVKIVVDAEIKDETDLTIISRTKKYLGFRAGEPGLMLLDIDLKAMPDTVKHRIDECGGVFGALCKVLPEIKDVARVERASTSSRLYDTRTSEPVPGSGGMHIAIPVFDAADIPRYLSDLHDRCWLAGFGWGMVSGCGSFLERALIDKSCGSPERLIFEGPPIVEWPLKQLARPRRRRP